MNSKNTELYFIENVDVRKKRIYLSNFIYDKKRVYMGTLEEAKYYKKTFLQALDRNIFLVVEFDNEKGIILQ